MDAWWVQALVGMGVAGALFWSIEWFGNWFIERMIRRYEFDQPVSAEIARAQLELPTKHLLSLIKVMRRIDAEHGIGDLDLSHREREALLALRTRIALRGNLTPEAWERQFPDEPE